MIKKSALIVAILSISCISTVSLADSGSDRSGIESLEKQLGIPSVSAGKQDDTAAPTTVFSKCTPNPFALCNGPRPPKEDRYMRACWDKLCPEQKKQFQNKFN